MRNEINNEVTRLKNVVVGANKETQSFLTNHDSSTLKTASNLAELVCRPELTYEMLSEIDLNRMFPGNTEGPMMEKVASAVVADIAGSDMCIDLHSSDTFIREVPQVRLSEVWAEAILPYAMLMNVNMCA